MNTNLPYTTMAFFYKIYWNISITNKSPIHHPSSQTLWPHISVAVLSLSEIPRFGSHVYITLPTFFPHNLNSNKSSTCSLKIKLLIHSYAVHLKIIRLIGLMINADHLEIKLNNTTYNRWKNKCYVNTNLS